MENKSHHRRLTASSRKCGRHAGKTSTRVPTGTTKIHDLANELLELVLLRVGSSVCLVRAAAACKPWRRVIAADGFLRRFRSLHGPHVIGYFHGDAATHVFVPKPGEASISASNRMSLSFLSVMYGLRLTDCRGGLLAFLLSNNSNSSVVVCDPWTSQCRLLMLPPELQQSYCRCLGAFLLDSLETGTAPHMSNFRVLCLCFVKDEQDPGTICARVSVFSARHNRWLMLSSTAVDNDVALAALLSGLTLNMSKLFVGRVADSLFWSLNGSAVIQVNESTGTFSSFSLSHFGGSMVVNKHIDRRKVRAVVFRDGRTVRIVCIVKEDLVVLQLLQGRGVCQQEKRISLSQLCNVTEAGPDRPWYFLEMSEEVAPGCVVLSPDEEGTGMISVDVESMEAERMQKRNSYNGQMFPYELPWPPNIKAGL